QHRGGNFQGPVRRRVRRPAVRRDLRSAARCKAGRDGGPGPDRKTQEELTSNPNQGVMMLSRLTTRSAAFTTALVATGARSGTALAQKKYDTGATDTEIKIGNIMPYSGPASAYGVIGKTEEAYFKKINAEGGIKGRKINFVSYDD